MERPKIIFLGSETRKSSKEYLEVRMVRNIRTEVQEAKKDSVSAIVKIMKRMERVPGGFVCTSRDSEYGLECNRCNESSDELVVPNYKIRAATS